MDISVHDGPEQAECGPRPAHHAPSAGMTQIRLQGIFSARAAGTPGDSAPVYRSGRPLTANNP
ncbi:hypothetical protein VI26_13070 [Chromobacterium sp. LK1]|nr:hypothetical protein VI26_13070 [Chromobacterium sp. LK1]